MLINQISHNPSFFQTLMIVNPVLVRTVAHVMMVLPHTHVIAPRDGQAMIVKRVSIDFFLEYTL